MFILLYYSEEIYSSHYALTKILDANHKFLYMLSIFQAIKNGKNFFLAQS